MNDLARDQNLLQAENVDPNPDPIAPFGPIELNLLDRVENGLNASENPNPESNNGLETPANEREKYEGPKEVIFVTGWVNINGVYERYKWAFVAKIFIGILVVACLLSREQNFWPVAAALVAINLMHIGKNAYFLHRYWDSNSKIKVVFWFELQISFCYFLYFLGFLLFMLSAAPARVFLFMTLPYFALTLFFFLNPSDSNLFLSQKRFSILESIQLCLIAIKFVGMMTISWNYVLIFFMAAAIYITILGLLMSIILSCSIFGFLYRELETWKVKALIWMTWYYLYTGLVLVYLIKGVVSYYKEEDVLGIHAGNYVTYKSDDYDGLYVSAVLFSIFSLVGLVFHIMWKDEIKKYLTRVIYKHELQKEISLRFLTKSFTFNLIQVSATYFLRPDSKLLTEEKLKQLAQKPKEPEKEPCIFCYDQMPNILMDPCGHGGVCKNCIITYLRSNEGKCPFDKRQINRLFLIEWDEAQKSYAAKGEIKFRA